MDGRRMEPGTNRSNLSADAATRRKAKPGTDIGTGYGRPAGAYRRELTEVGAGTPMGELLRRYWHPIALTQDATDTPRRIRHLGEDLILFRAGNGRPGLVV